MNLFLCTVTTFLIMYRNRRAPWRGLANYHHPKSWRVHEALDAAGPARVLAGVVQGASAASGLRCALSGGSMRSSSTSLTTIDDPSENEPMLHGETIDGWCVPSIPFVDCRGHELCSNVPSLRWTLQRLQGFYALSMYVPLQPIPGLV